MRRWLVVPLLVAATPQVAATQQPQDSIIAPRQDSTIAARPQPTAGLTLADALGQARTKSPAYQQVLNNAAPARWGVRNAYGNFLPSLNLSGAVGYTGSGESQFGAFFARTSPFVSSNYQVGLQWSLDGRVLAGPGQQKALQRATGEDIEDAGVSLRADVTTQYLNVLAAVAQTEVAREQVKRNNEFLRLARARHQVGQATLLDVRQAEATRATSEVALLQGYQAENEAKLELFRRIGVPPPVPVQQIALTDSFPVAPPVYSRDELVKLAEEQNPSLKALRERETAARANVRAVRSDFFPRLTAQAGWSGFTQQFTSDSQLLTETLVRAQGLAAQCQFNNQIRTGLSLGGVVPDCFGPNGLDPIGGRLLHPAAQQIRDANNVFPFNFTSQPFQAALTVSLPIFTGFSRHLQLAEARAQQQDADESVRAQGLLVRANVEGRYLALGTSYQAIAAQATGREAAREQLRLAQDRYRVGLGSALEVSDAQNAVQRAEGDYITAVYDYHRAIAALEAAVGRPLR
jgi:outer membrane protein